MLPLDGQVALVAGATRGAGRGIARMLGEAGATVYCTGRSSRSAPIPPRDTSSPFALTGRPETIEETADLVTGHGGRGIAVRVDHSDEAAVQALFARVAAEQGRLDILVNDIWGGDALTEWNVPFWELDLARGWRMLERAVHTHIITSRYAVPLLIRQNRGLLIEITDGDTAAYRGTLFYDMAKAAVIRLAFGMAAELRPHGVTALALTPGFLRSEVVLEYLGVSEANWQDGALRDPHFIASETPCFVGRAVAALAADPQVATKAGGVYSSWEISEEYGFCDIDGRRPHWGRYAAANLAQEPDV
ncbi:SDR family NAD(P)-dependent oxidoreductase [Chloroflexales bacterium ZM16-3]|nr:SDR family NAD(P)-dependent oxidoreductase [Chloroflexales bacterium ZM16-3]